MEPEERSLPACKNRQMSIPDPTQRSSRSRINTGRSTLIHPGRSEIGARRGVVEMLSRIMIASTRASWCRSRLPISQPPSPLGHRTAARQGDGSHSHLGIRIQDRRLLLGKAEREAKARIRFLHRSSYWTQANPEQCLMATRGKPMRRAKEVRRPVFESRREHSRKPDCVRERIERLVDGPYLELFVRETKPG